MGELEATKIETRAYFPYFSQCDPKIVFSSGTTGGIGLETQVMFRKWVWRIFSVVMLLPQLPHPRVSEKGIPLS